MDTLELILLFDYYGNLLTDRMRECFDLRYNQDLSLGEIAEELGISRQGVHENITRAEQRLMNMEEQTGCVRRLLQSRQATQAILEATAALAEHSDTAVRLQAARIEAAARMVP